MKAWLTKNINHDKIRKMALNVFLAIFITNSCFMLLVALSNIKIVLVYNDNWKLVDRLLSILFVVSLGVTLIYNRVNGLIKSGIIKLFMLSTLATLAMLLITRMAVFAGVATIFHYFTAQPGTILVNVVKKEDNYIKARCSPRLYIQEFSHWTFNHLCPSEKLYKQTSVGDKIIIKGQVSSFGVKVEATTRLPKSITPAQFNYLLKFKTRLSTN